MQATMSTMSWKPRYFDIGVNISDLVFTGGLRHRHASHAALVLSRGRLVGVETHLITSLTLHDSESNLALGDSRLLFCTVGVHPCLAGQEFYTRKRGTLSDSEPHFSEVLHPSHIQRFNELASVATEGHKSGVIRAFGELGLDYDRLHFLSKPQQQYVFRKQLETFSLLEFELPYFLHMRAACDDFIDIISTYVKKGLRGVVHSFTGSENDLQKLLLLGFYVSVNGCSLRTEENLQVAAQIPLDKLMIETDAPYCEFRKNSPARKLYITPYPNKFLPAFLEPVQRQLNDLLAALAAQKQNQSAQRQKENHHRQTGGELPAKTTAKNSMAVHPLVPFVLAKSGDLEHYKELVESLAEQHTSTEPNLFAKDGALESPILLGRNEPLFVAHVAEVMAGLHKLESEVDVQKFIDQIYDNTCKFFGVDPADH